MALLGSKFNRPPTDHSELWIVSYADMMTLLFGFFVILYSFSQIDERKLNSVGKQLAEAFGGEKKEETSEVGMMMDSRHLKALQLLVAMLNLGDSVDDAVEKLERKISDAKNMEGAKEIVLENVKNKEDLAFLRGSTTPKEDRIEIAMPDVLLFEPGGADLTFRAKGALRKVASLLNSLPDMIGLEVSGHTDSTPGGRNSRYPSNWALSSARAGAVAEELIKDGVDSHNLITRGLASLQPLFPERSPDGTFMADNAAKNRRVTIVIKKLHSPESPASVAPAAKK